MKSNTEYKTSKKLKKELKTLKRAVKIMFLGYVISIIIILFSI